MSAGDLDALIEARVQRVDGPRPGLFALTLHRPDRHGCLVIQIDPTLTWGWVPERPRGEPASALVQQLRKHLEGGRIRAIEVDGAGAWIEIRREHGGSSAVPPDPAAETARVVHDRASVVRPRLRRSEHDASLRLDAKPPNLVLIVGGVVVGALRPSDLPARGAGLGRPWPAGVTAGAALATDELEAAGARIVTGAVERSASGRAQVLTRAVSRRLTKLRRRLVAIQADLDRLDEVEPLRQRASVILSHLHAIPSDASEAELMDWHADPPRPIRVAIDPRRGPKGEADALFRQARKLERGAKIALERHTQTKVEVDALEVLGMAAPSADEAALDELERRAARLGVRTDPRPRGSAPTARLPYRTYRGSGDRRILVGRSAADNDALTLHVARPHDHWLHARGVPGSHVIVPLARGEACPPELLVDAAHLAAHFSDARGEPQVEVQHTSRRYVRKPRGAPPGAVVLTAEKAMLLRVEPERVTRLMASEDLAVP